MFVKKKKKQLRLLVLKLKHSRSVYKNMFSIQIKHEYSRYILL